tara:strand:+ start:796 stop:2025 length:1230 start_codon:yes stop_codon:yes gene_type:complete
MYTILIDILYVLLMLLSVGSIVYWFAIAYQVRKTRKGLPTARDGIGLSELNPPTQRVCVVVPCHNEAGNIATLIHSLKDQDYDRLKVVLSLDRCTDDTMGVAREAIGHDDRFEIIEVTQCPDDWAGKVHAAYTGFTESEHARVAEVLIFTDADTWLDPACVRSSVALLNDRGLDFLSLLSTLNSKTWFERIVQPITAFELARQYPLLKVNLQNDQQRAFANGQFMMFTSKAYHAIGGHESVKHAILEDIAFARKIHKEKLAGGLLLADNMLKCRMYDSWEEYTRGWKRIYTESANREVRRLKRYARRTPGLCFGLPVASVCLVVLAVMMNKDSTLMVGVPIGILGVLAWFVGMGSVYRMSHARLIDIPGALIGSVLTGGIFSAAAKDLTRGTPTKWGGKSYVRKAEDVG